MSAEGLPSLEGRKATRPYITQPPPSPDTSVTELEGLQTRETGTMYRLGHSTTSLPALDNRRTALVAASSARGATETESARTLMRLTDEDSSSPPEMEVEGKERPASALERCKAHYLRACKRLGISPLSRFIKQLGQRTIDVSGEALGCKGVNALCSTLMHREDVSCLNLSDNCVGAKSISYISQLLSENIFITDLKLRDNSLNGEKSKLIGEMLKVCRTLRKLDISGNKMSDEDSRHIADIIRNSQEIVELRMSQNELREKGGMWIGEALGVNESIEYLDLSWNHLRGRGAECVAVGLMKNTTLVRLDISWNGFAFQGCAALGCALRHNSTLTDLDVSNNRVHPPALMELLKGIAGNTGLVRLVLGPNPITAVCTTPILGTIYENLNSQIRLLDMTSIVVDDTFEELLETIQSQTPDFLVFYERSLPVHKLRFERRKQTLAVLKNKTFNVDPLRILWFAKKNLRIVDLFHKIDKDSNARLSRDEIRMLLERDNYKLSSSALDNIMDYLDTDKDGEVDLQEFADAERRFKREAIATATRITDRDMLGVETKQGDIPVDPGGLAGRFSTTYRPDLPKLDYETGLESPSGDPMKRMSRTPSDALTKPRTTPRKTDEKSFDKLPDINKRD